MKSKRRKKSRGAVRKSLLLWVALGLTLAAGFVSALPPSPSGLAVLPPYDGQANLQWAPEISATSAVTAYQVSRVLLDLTSTPTPTPTGTLPPVDTATPLAVIPASAMTQLAGTPVFQDFQVTNGRAYLYQVSAIDSTGAGTGSSVTVFPFSQPSAVQPVTVQNLHSDALDLSWGVPQSSNPVAYYRIYRSFVPGLPTLTPLPTPLPASTVLTAAPTPVATSDTTSFSDGGAGSLGASAIYYVVLGVDNLGNQGALPTFSTNPAVPVTLAPKAPVLTSLVALTATPVIGTTGYGVRLIWNGAVSSEGVTLYTLNRNGVPIATFLVTPTPQPTQVYDDTGIQAVPAGGAPSLYVVTAYSALGSADSNPVTDIIVKPSFDGPLQVTPDATHMAVTLTWPQATPGTYGFNGYRLYKNLGGVPSPGTITPTPYAVLQVTPSTTPTLLAVDTPIVNHMAYWVDPFDAEGGGFIAVATPSALNLAPTPPSGVGAANPVGNNQIAVSWTGEGAGFFGQAQNYILYRVPATATSPTPVATVSATVTLLNDFVSGLPAGTSVAYQVAAVDALGNVSDLSTLSNSVVLQALTLPSTPVVQPVSGTSTSLLYSWALNPSSDQVDGYSIFGSNWPTLTVTPTPVATVLPTPGALVYSKSSLTAWKADINYLSAHNSMGYGSPALLAGIPTGASTVFAAITPGTRQAQVFWTMVPTPASTPSIDSYGVYRSPSSGASFTLLATVPLSSPAYTDPSLEAGKRYYYRITSRASVGSGVAEGLLYPTITPTPEAAVLSWPNTPVAVTAVGGGAQNTLSWIPNAAGETVLSYAILRNGSPALVITPSPTLVIGITETPGTVSSYQVQAQNAAGNSDLSGTVQALSAPAVTPTIALTPPPAFLASLTTTPSPTPVLTPAVWISNLSYAGAVDGYIIYRSTDAGFSWATTVSAVSNPVSFLFDPDFLPGCVNYYRVVASSGTTIMANPSASAQGSVTFPPLPPEPLVLGGSASSVSLVWATPSGNAPITNYTVYRSVYPTTTPTAILAQVSPPAVQYVDSAVTPGVAYYYSVQAPGPGGTNGPTSIQALIPLQPPTLYLTPATGKNFLIWSPVPPPPAGSVTGYSLYRAQPTPGMPLQYFPLVNVDGLSNTAYTDTSVSDKVTYVYKVAARNLSYVLSGFSNSVTVTVYPQPFVLGAVSGDQLVQLRWNNGGAVNVTQSLQRKLGSADDSTYETIRAGVTGDNYLDTGVRDKTFYTYRLVTVDASGLTVIGPAVNAFPAKPPVVSNGVVTLVQNEKGNLLSWYPADLTLPPPSPIFDPATMYPLGGYNIYSSPDGGATYQKVGSVGVSQTSFLDPVPLVGGTAHTYQVRAYDIPGDDPTMAHETPYNLVTAYALGAGTALDRNAIRPFGAPNEQSVNIRFVVQNPGVVNIRVYSLNGTFVKELLNKSFGIGVYGLPASNYPLSWDARNMNGTLVASGVYLITTEMNGHRAIAKIAVIK